MADGILVEGTDDNDTLIGSADNDTISGGLGDDVMIGGDGDDIYIVDSFDDVVTEDADAGTDTIKTALSHYQIAANVENLIQTGIAGQFSYGNELSNTMTANDNGGVMYGMESADTLIGGAGNDTLYGNGETTDDSSSDVLDGGAGDDTLDGGLGGDTMIGGIGDDTYFVDSRSDVVTEDADAGTDTIKTALSHYQIKTNVENLVQTGTAGQTTYGNALANTITLNENGGIAYGFEGADTIVGGAGNDELYGYGETTDDGSSDVLNGGAGNDILDGGVGGDTMIGGIGDDTYFVDSRSDVVTEDADAGTDTIKTALSHYQIKANVENLVQTGTAGQYTYGNALANTITLNENGGIAYGFEGADTIVGGAGNDELYGYGETTDDGSSDVLNGGAGNDILDGGVGGDTMVGGVGDDTYFVDSRSDVVTEDAGAGTDTIKTALSHYQIKANVENLVQTGTVGQTTYGNALANTITLNENGGIAYGFEGADTIVGGAGNDELYGYGETTDDASSDVLIGGAGNDILDGGAGDDTMTGGAGNDTYFVDSRNDIMVEDVDGGIDTIKTAISHYLIRDNIENIIQIGDAGQFSYGNTLDNTMTSVNDGGYLYGQEGNDTLIGGAGDDTLDGGTGIDKMTGGAGNDTYGVDSTSDVIVEAKGQGTDTVDASINYTLGNHLENLTLLGSDDDEIADSNLNGTGNTAANTIIGNDGNNKLYGLEGADKLYGGKGNDVLDGGTGGDEMTGGVGDDSYYVNTKLDKVIEAANGGIDRINSSVTYTLGSNVEKLTLTGDAAISGTGNELANTLLGNDAANTLKGLGDADVLSGHGGNDKLYGGAGIDTLTGGTGADTFYFAAGDTAAKRAQADTITDFSLKQHDVINLAAIDANGSKKGDQAFDFIGTDAFTHHAGELRYIKGADDTYIIGDINGDGKADFTIHLDGSVKVTEDFFAL